MPTKRVIMSAGVLFFTIFMIGAFFLVQKTDRNVHKTEIKVDEHEIVNFNDCVNAGYPVMESYPRQCRTASGKHFVENIDKGIDISVEYDDQKNWNEKYNLIRLEHLQPGSYLNHPNAPFIVEGEARGYWFFEATFPVLIEDDKGNVLGSHYAEATSEWMTESFVPFRAEVPWSIGSTSESAFLVLSKHNASGLPEHSDELRVPLQFLWE